MRRSFSSLQHWSLLEKNKARTGASTSLNVLGYNAASRLAYRDRFYLNINRMPDHSHRKHSDMDGEGKDGLRKTT